MARMLDDVLTTKEAASEYGCIERYITEEIARGNLPATKKGRDWFIRRVDFERWRKQKNSRNTK